MSPLLTPRRAMVVAVGACLVLFALWVNPRLPRRVRNRALNLNRQDARLVDRVLRAAEQRVRPEQVEAFVGTPATINTRRDPFHRKVILLARIGEDESEGGRDELAALYGGLRNGAVGHAAFWIRPVEGENPRLVGVYWAASGEARVFFGVVYPPG
jgi:hypothetical protein